NNDGKFFLGDRGPVIAQHSLDGVRPLLLVPLRSNNVGQVMAERAFRLEHRFALSGRKVLTRCKGDRCQRNRRENPHGHLLKKLHIKTSWIQFPLIESISSGEM